jgi:hypothetical protein
LPLFEGYRQELEKEKLEGGLTNEQISNLLLNNPLSGTSIVPGAIKAGFNGLTRSRMNPLIPPGRPPL